MTYRKRILTGMKGDTPDRMPRASDTNMAQEAIQFREDSIAGGSYIRLTKDQHGQDTPDENIFKLVFTCEKCGKD